jgi:NADH dehydrogenase FAD-containing subunit
MAHLKRGHFHLTRKNTLHTTQVFTPMLASAAVGTVEYRSMTEPIRVTNPFIDNFVEGRAIGIDVPNRRISVQLTSLATVTGAFRGVAANAPDRLEPEPIVSAAETAETGGGAGRVVALNYDYLVCAVGTSVRSTVVPGAKEHCFNLKTTQDSKRLRTAIGEALEYVSWSLIFVSTALYGQ